MQQELGQPATAVFSSISAKPVAAASLGQVYRATLRSTGADVAVKVQRPGVLELVALDLVIGRKGVEIAGALFPDLVRADDFLPVLDEWAFKLYREMDYRREASVMSRFQDDMKELQGIMIPQVRRSACCACCAAHGVAACPYHRRFACMSVPRLLVATGARVAARAYKMSGLPRRKMRSVSRCV